MPSPRVPPFSHLTLADIPPRVGLFPLKEALLLPGGHLPLSVFEPRYIALVEDALAKNRTIGLIQPLSSLDGTDEEIPPLASVGTLGRITSFSEHKDGCFSITLTGLCRFSLLRDDLTARGWREGMINATPFTQDLLENSSIPLDRDAFMPLLKNYLDIRQLKTNWAALQHLEDERLLTELPMLLPFSAAEKQSLLEAANMTERTTVLLKILHDNTHSS